MSRKKLNVEASGIMCFNGTAVLFCTGIGGTMDIADEFVPWVAAFFLPVIVLAMAGLSHLIAWYLLFYCIFGVIVVLRRAGSK